MSHGSEHNCAAQLLSCAVSGVVLLDWSKTGAFLVTAQRPSKGEDGQPAKNIKVWEVASGLVVLELGVKSVNKESWPLLQWSHGDEVLYHSVTNTVHQYSRATGFKAAKKIPIKGVSSFQPCPAPGKQLLAAFIPELKGQPAVATVVDCSGDQPVTISRKSFYRATGASMMWNQPSTACLFMATSETDATNQSYYGESKLHYLPAEADRADGACSVAMPKDGPVHDVQWSPAGDFFVVVAGFMPAQVILHDSRCKPVYDMGSGPYNIARWNPFGRFLAIAGFGNLPGDVVFYNKLAKGNCKQMGATRSGSAVTAEWSPCGRFLMTATTAPRLRVDNNVRIFTYYGEKVCEQPFDTLPPAMRTLQSHLAAGAAAINSGPTFSLAYDNSSKPGRISQQTGKPLPPGADFVSKAAGKNAKKRANKKGKAAAGAGDDEADEEQGSAAACGAADADGAADVAQQLASVSVTGVDDDSADAAQKRVRALQKKLRQIQQLKEKQSKEGVGALGPEQLQKIEGEAAIVAEIQQLAIGLATCCILLVRGRSLKYVSLTAYFTAMEVLQFLQYQVTDRCDSKWNQLLTLLAYIHVAFQPLVWNEFVFGLPQPAFCKRIISTAVDPVMHWVVRRLSLAASLLLVLKATPAFLQLFGLNSSALLQHLPVAQLSSYLQPIETGCIQHPEMICGPRLCSMQGKFHVGWSVPSLPHSYYIPSAFLHGFFFFVPALVLGGPSQRALATAAFVTGPLLTEVILGGDEEARRYEWASIWCMFSLGQVLLLFAVELAGTLQCCGTPHLPAAADWERLFGRLLPEEEMPSAEAGAVTANGADGDEGSFIAKTATETMNQTAVDSFHSKNTAQQRAALMGEAKGATGGSVSDVSQATPRRSERLRVRGPVHEL
eukprot:gene12064-12206_t